MRCKNPNETKKVLSEVLKRIKPTQKERAAKLAAANKLIGMLAKVVPSSVKLELAGSLAKDTDLKGKNEFDIFLLFPRHYSHHEIALLGLSYARKAFSGLKVEARYAEHPYLQVKIGKYKADVVPAYNITKIDQKGSSVDRSILHTKYINSTLSAQQKDDVRLLKAFLAALDIYGAELRVEGFSGYLCELLISHYGSFVLLLEAASEWREPAIDIAQYYTESPRKFFQSPLVVIDPIDPKRNVAAVVAQTSLSRFIFSARKFLQSPSVRFFFPQRKSFSPLQIKKEIRARGSCCLLASFPAPHVVPDVLWPQLKKTTQALAQRLGERGFRVFGYYHWSDGAECAIFIELESRRLPSVQKLVGPSIYFAKDTEAFIKKHSSALNIHLEHDRVVAIERRKTVDALSALAEECKAGRGVPAHMKDRLKGAKIYEGTNIVQPKYCSFLSDYFFAKIT
ncbi:MAG: CCA tRNA nucleotidyltransferase [Candidatus Micrarchaeota archaeon]|nr:CCA tRNA nucleotidyltransferase [Candidatus Micrarchaeota archaeon]